MMRKAVISGLGFITCLGNTASEVEAKIRTLTCGLTEHDLMPGVEGAKRLIGKPEGFSFPSPMYLS